MIFPPGRPGRTKLTSAHRKTRRGMRRSFVSGKELYVCGLRQWSEPPEDGFSSWRREAISFLEMPLLER